ncbi:TPA: hypothetical protein ACH3X3_001552 [Trebouxia sp. C0006]
MQAREQLFLEKDEIVKLVEWKLTRGKWKPKLLDYAKHASEEEVVGTTKKAFACLGSAEAPALQKVEEALKELISLKLYTYVETFISQDRTLQDGYTTVGSP